MTSVSPLRYIFNCNDSTQTMDTARKMLKPVGRIINESPALNGSFLVATTKKKADEFAAANLRWAVYPEIQVSLPANPHRLRIVKPPKND